MLTPTPKEIECKKCNSKTFYLYITNYNGCLVIETNCVACGYEESRFDANGYKPNYSTDCDKCSRDDLPF